MIEARVDVTTLILTIVMETMFLAKIIGIYLLVGSLSGLLHPQRMRNAMSDFMKSTILPFFDGALALIVGLLIVLTHNVWTDLASTIISLVGWIAVVEGFVMLLLPEESLKGLMKGLTSKSLATALMLVGVVAGAYLTYVGFFM